MNDLVEAKVEALATLLLETPQVPCNVRHLFYPGLYIRELTAPAGIYAIGYVHKTAHMNVLLRGVVRVVLEDGSVGELRAPLTYLGKPGRNICYIVEEMVWLNIYPTEERDVEKLDEMFLEPSPAMNGHLANLPLALNFTGYDQMLEDLGVTDELVQLESSATADLIPFPIGEYKVKIGRSEIAGKGLICTSSLRTAEFICPASVGGRRTPAGRYTNHSDNPNAMAVVEGDTIYFVAVRDIQGCLGGMDGEEITVDYRQTYALRRSMLT